MGGMRSGMLFITRVVCRILLILLHACMHIADTLFFIKHKVVHKIKYRHVNNTRLDVKLGESASVDCRLKVLKKLPKHLVIFIAESFISYQDVANLIVWCLFVRIPYVTVYDVEGAIKKRWQHLYGEVLCSQERHLGYSNPSKVVWHTKHRDAVEKNGHNGYKQRIHVRPASREDGRPLLVEAARRIAERVKSGEMGIKDVGPDIIQRHISEWPDPDVLLRLGNVHSVLGYQPWELRLTEMISLPTHRGVMLSEFFDALHKYSSCNQRFGK